MVLLAKIYLKRLQEININHCVKISYKCSVVMFLKVTCNIKVQWPYISLGLALDFQGPGEEFLINIITQKDIWHFLNLWLVYIKMQHNCLICPQYIRRQSTYSPNQINIKCQHFNSMQLVWKLSCSLYQIFYLTQPVKQTVVQRTLHLH